MKTSSALSSIKFSLFAVLTITLLTFSSCTEDNPGEASENLYGNYESVEFSEPGSNDGGVDIQSNGGYMKISFDENNKFTSEIFIPENLQSNYPKGKTNYSGDFTVENDSLKLFTIPMVNEFIWDKEKKEIKTYTQTRFGNINILLKRKN